MFCALSQNYLHLFEKKIYASYSKLSKELKNSIKIKIGQAGSWVIDPNNILTVLIFNLKLIGQLKFQWPILSSLNNLLWDAYFFFPKKVLIISR